MPKIIIRYSEDDILEACLDDTLKKFAWLIEKRAVARFELDDAGSLKGVVVTESDPDPEQVEDPR